MLISRFVFLCASNGDVRSVKTAFFFCKYTLTIILFTVLPQKKSRMPVFDRLRFNKSGWYNFMKGVSYCKLYGLIN